MIGVEGYSPEELYDFLTAALQPRPVVLVSTTDGAGAVNIAPFSFVTLGGFDPPSLVFSVTANPEGKLKETLLNLERVPEFVVGIVDRSVVDLLAPLGFVVRERDAISLAPSGRIQPLRVLACPVQLECRVHQIAAHGAAHYVIGEVVGVHLRDGLENLNSEYAPISRLGGAEYLDLGNLEKFQI